MTVVFNLFGPTDANYIRRAFAGFSLLVVLEAIRYGMCNALGGYFLPGILKGERKRVSCLCLLGHASMCTLILAAFEPSTYGEAFVLGMVLAVLTNWTTYMSLFYINPMWRRLSFLGDICVAAVCWGLVMLGMKGVEF